MIRIIIDIRDALDEDYLEISRCYEDILQEAAYKHRFQSELVTDSHREAA
jgi:hypothetical protein